MSGVVEGKEGYLFLDNDTNRSVEQVEGRYPLSPRFFTMINVCHEVRAFLCKARATCTYSHIIVPNKESVLREYLSDSIVWGKSGLPPVYKYKSLFPSSRSFFGWQFGNQEDRPRFFAKTDTHWTHLGAIEYLRAFADARDPTLSVLLRRVESRTFKITQLGDLGRKIDLPAEELDNVQPLVHRGKMVFTNGIQNEGCLRHYLNEHAPIKGRLLFNHDSTGTWLFSWLTEIFSDMVCIHCPDFDIEVVEQLKPVHNIFMQIERFFTRIPTNEFNLLNFIGDQEQKKGAQSSAVEYLQKLMAETR